MMEHQDLQNMTTDKMQKLSFIRSRCLYHGWVSLGKTEASSLPTAWLLFAAEALKPIVNECVLLVSILKL
jgi:hypothetical protein